MISTVTNPALRSLFEGGVRRLAASILAFVVLVPVFYGFAPLLANLSGACETHCGAKTHGCCRRPGSEGWKASPSCPKGCGLQIGLPSLMAAGLNTRPVAVGPAALKEQWLSSSVPARICAGAEFALFERPPPSFLNLTQLSLA